MANYPMLLNMHTFLYKNAVRRLVGNQTTIRPLPDRAAWYRLARNTNRLLTPHSHPRNKMLATPLVRTVSSHNTQLERVCGLAPQHAPSSEEVLKLRVQRWRACKSMLTFALLRYYASETLQSCEVCQRKERDSLKVTFSQVSGARA